MTTSPKPWADAIPAEDLTSFAREFDAEERPLSAGNRPAVLVVDMTRAFVDSAYPTGWSETGYPAARATARLLEKARVAGVPVLYTKTYLDSGHEATPAERGRWKLNREPAKLPAGTPPGDVIHELLAPEAGDIVIGKGSKPSAFFGTPLASYLIHLGCDTVIVTGMTTSGCVRATVLDAFQYNFHVIVPFDCTADRSQVSHKVNLFDIHMKYADVVSLDEVASYLDSLGRSSALVG